VGQEKPREIAVRTLRKHAAGAGFLDDLLEAELANSTVSAADRALLKELTHGVVRWQRTLDWLIARKTGDRSQKADLQILLRLGLYQLFWLSRIPDHAAVHETVDLAKRLGHGHQSGFVNAVLRGCLRERDATAQELEALKAREPALGHSHPDWLWKRWTACWGQQEAIKLLEWNNTPPKAFARLNTLRGTTEKLMRQWDAEGVTYENAGFDWAPDDVVFELNSFPPLAVLESFALGWFYVQDPSTLLAVYELGARPGEHVLDLCAAPGGKTTAIAQHMANRGNIVATDISASRLRRVQENCARLGAVCVTTQLISKDVSKPDVAEVQIRSWEEMSFDRVLLDVPCSNTGVMRRRVDLRWRIREEEIARLTETQLALLERAAPVVEPGGTLVYSTCSLEPEENREVVDRFLGSHSEFRLESDRTLLPFRDGVDGAYVAKLQKTGSA
jgi:16S rRNA (cytosine967-C5)-methyltransferase